MLSKLLPNHLRLLLVKTPQKHCRKIFGLIPPNQYDIPIPKKFHIGYVLKEYWETIPLFITSFISISLVVLIVIYDARNKMDIVFTTHSRDTISRTMDLRNPSIHKLMIINQRYEPWPEMADVLDKMKAAEKRLLMRMQTCNHP